jgi:hypothetical protein
VLLMTFGGEMGDTDALGPVLGPRPVPNIKKYILRVDHDGRALAVTSPICGPSSGNIKFGTS